VKPWWLAALVALPLVGVAQDVPHDVPHDVQGGVELPKGAPALDVAVPRMDNAVAQLAHARRLKLQTFRKGAGEKRFYRKLAIEAYRAVRAYHPSSDAVVAEAAFRAAELLRAMGDVVGARAELDLAAGRGAGTDFRPRARLEIGHLERRVGRSRAALDAYLAVASDPRARARYRDDAWLWAGRVWRDQGRIEEARRAWRTVCECAEDPLDRIVAWDWRALSWLETTDPEAAAGVLDQCLRALAPVALEESEQGERVRNALLRMRVVDALQRAIERRAAESPESERESPP
jgi:tetratricopeptide (TPR) repeat protein